MGLVVLGAVSIASVVVVGATEVGGAGGVAEALAVAAPCCDDGAVLVGCPVVVGGLATCPEGATGTASTTVFGCM